MEQLKSTLHSAVDNIMPTWFTSDFQFFVSTMLLLWAVRVIILKSLVRLGRSSYAEQYRITKKPLLTDAQLERESVWVYGYFYDFVAALLAYYIGFLHDLPLFVSDSILWYFVFHATVVEFLYYWFHRLLHVSWFYKNFHQYHHKSINTEPTTGLSFEIAERVSYTLLFSIAPFCVTGIGYQCYTTFFLYYVWFDIMNEGGHINFEALPDWYHSSPLKWIFYSPTFHSVHHTKFKKNYTLFMPWCDLLFGTAIYKDTTASSESLLPTHAKSEKKADFVLLVHAGYLASALWSSKLNKLTQLLQLKNKYQHQPWMYLLYPYLLIASVYYSMIRTGFHTEEDFDFLAPMGEANPTQKLFVGSTWIVRNIGAHYLFKSYKKQVTSRIEEAVLEAQNQGVKVIGLGNFNKAEWINHGGLDIVEKYKDKLNGTYISHGDTLSAAVVFQYILWLREQNYWKKSVFVTGSTSKIGRALCLQLIKLNISVYMYSQCRARFEEIAAEAPPDVRPLLVYCDKLNQGSDCDLWLTGKMIPKGMQLMNAIPKNATIVNFSVPDPLSSKLLMQRPDLLHLDSGLLQYDSKVMNPDFTWLLPSGKIFACLAGCIVHSILGIQEHEVGPVKIEDMNKYWKAAIELGFSIPPHTSFYDPITLPPPRVI